MQSNIVEQNIASLTGVRFLFASMVIAFHSHNLLATAFPFRYVPVLSNLVDLGYVGVSCFFVLSGFIMVHTYAPRLSTTTFASFMQARFARLFPVYVLGLVVVAPFAFATGAAHALTTLPFQVFFIQAWFPRADIYFSWNGPNWSLSAEAFFYFVFILLLRRFMRLRLKTGVLVVALTWLPLLLITIAIETFSIWPLAGLAGNEVGMLEVRRDEFPQSMDLVLFSPIFWMPVFGLGAISARLTHHWHRSADKYATSLLWLGIAGLLATLTLIPGAVPLYAMSVGAIAPFVAMTLIGLSLSAGGRVQRVLESRLLVYLGGASYAMYILHLPIKSWLDWLDEHNVILFHRLHPIAHFGLYFLTVVGVSALVFSFYEQPMRRLLSRRQNSPSRLPFGSPRESAHGPRLFF